MLLLSAVTSGNYASSAAQRFIDAAGITDSTEKSALKRLVDDLFGVPNGSYTTMNIFFRCLAIYPFVGGTSSTCSFNLVNPSLYPLTFVSSPSFSSTGYIGNTTSYMTTGIVPSTAMTINDTHISFRNVTPVNVSGQAGMGSANSSAQRISGYARFTADAYQADMYNTSARAQTTNSSTNTVFFTASRTNSTTFALLKDGVSVATHGATGGTLPTGDIAIGGTNNGAGYTPIGVARTINFATIGKGLTDAQSLALHNAQDFFNTTTLSR